MVIVCLPWPDMTRYCPYYTYDHTQNHEQIGFLCSYWTEETEHLQCVSFDAFMVLMELIGPRSTFGTSIIYRYLIHPVSYHTLH